MKKLIVLAILAVLGTTAGAWAGPQLVIPDKGKAAEQAAWRRLHDHPLAQVVPARDLSIKITDDFIMRPCCMPPTLVVAGNIENTASRPLDYVKLILAFENQSGKIVHAENFYNHKAVSMGEDEEIRKFLREDPHFEPIPPGGTDNFAIQVPVPMLPAFTKVLLYSDQTRGVDKERIGAR